MSLGEDPQPTVIHRRPLLGSERRRREDGELLLAAALDAGTVHLMEPPIGEHQEVGTVAHQQVELT